MIISRLKSLWNNRKTLRYLHKSIYFNFHYLPLHQAIKLPILLYKPEFLSLKGRVEIRASKLYTGMIRLGFRNCGVYPNTGFCWENHGGNIIFEGRCDIGNDCFLAFGEKTKVVFKDDFICTAGLKLVSYRGITFGKGTRIGWGVLIMDTNFHPLYDLTHNKFKRASGTIEIGDFNWFGTQCKVMHSVKTPERCIWGMNTVVTRNSIMKSYCVMGGNPVRILTENVMRDYSHNVEE